MTAAAAQVSMISLPLTIPVFPLMGVVLPPRGRLPLNVFEPRYLQLVEDALGEGRWLGIVQPQEIARGSAPRLYEVGTLGRIASFAETDDQRFLVSLVGVCRFNLLTEEPLAGGGYHRFQVSYEAWQSDLDSDAVNGYDRPRLLASLRGYFRAQGINANWDAIQQADNEELITSLMMSCPFQPAEKQALLEAKTLSERVRLLHTLIEMAAAVGADVEGVRH